MPKDTAGARRDQVLDLTRKGESVASIARAMQRTKKAIEKDLDHIIKRQALDIVSQGQERILSGMLENCRARRMLIMAELNKPDTGDTARAKYISLDMNNDKEFYNYAEKLLDASTTVQRHELEDRLKAMSFEEFNLMIGLPEHPDSLLPRELTPAQMKVFNSIDRKKRTWLHLVKSRQVGMSELVLRTILYHSFSGKYTAKKIALCAGTRIEMAEQLFTRLRGILKPIRETVEFDRSDMIRLKNGTEFHLTPSSEYSWAGFEKAGAVFLDESARWGLSSDQVILDTFLPLARSSNADVYAISNPAGPRGYFHFLATHDSPGWTKMTIDIHEGGVGLFTEEEIQEKINTTSEDPASSYLCQFVGGRDSIFGDWDDPDDQTMLEAVRFD